MSMLTEDLATWVSAFLFTNPYYFIARNKLIFFKIYLFIRETDSVGGGADGETLQAGSLLSAETDAGLHLTTSEITT